MNRRSPIRRLFTHPVRWKRLVLTGLMLTLVLGLVLGLVLSLALLAWPTRHSTPPAAQASNGGFAGLGRAAEGFTQARPGQVLRFPEDHGAHPGFRTEWWYLTANLHDEQGRPLGVQWTLFRQALAPPAAQQDAKDAVGTTNPWASNQLWMAHAAVSQSAAHVVAERLSRGSPKGLAGPAGVRAMPFAAWIDDWQLTGALSETLSKALPNTLASTLSSSTDALSQLSVSATLDETTRYRLTLTAEGPLVAHGEAGFSQKAADGQGSFYYSQPFYRAEGEVTLNGETHRVSGRAWLDREWSSQLLSEAQQGWDWLSLHLADGTKLMAFRLRGGAAGGGETQGDTGDYLSGSLISADGTLTPLGPTELSLTPIAERSVAGRRLPTRWRLEVPGQGLDLTISARHPNRWMTTQVPYWEGAVTVEGPDGRPRGEGYLEMTGY
jgi:predicted secreted hydrolase